MPENNHTWGQRIFDWPISSRLKRQQKKENMNTYGHESKILGIRTYIGIKIVLLGILGWLLLSLFLGIIFPALFNWLIGA